MMAPSTTLPVATLSGLRADSLGHYLAALGLLRVTARRWPAVRAAWRLGSFCFVGGPSGLDELVGHVLTIARAADWTPYTREWGDAYKEQREREGKTLPEGEPSPLAVWQAQAPEDEVELSLAHSVVTDRLHNNPLLGTGGAASRRNFSNGWKTAVKEIKAEHHKNESTRRKRQELIDDDLVRFVRGDACVAPKETGWNWNAASWFSQANKLYNYSARQPSVEGQLSPWAMVLACEGLVLFSGSPSRRLAARARGRTAFPFVTDAAWPQTSDTLTHQRGEVWLPLWSRPMTISEVRQLFWRGKAELGGRGAVTPAAFAAAIMHRGVDAGVDGFARFVLEQTTNPDMFESTLAGRVTVPTRQPSSADGARSALAERVVTFIESLPRDFRASRDRGGRFLGLRGPVEAALIEYAAAAEDSERAAKLLDAVLGSLDRIDRSRRHREQGRTSLRLLPLTWLPTLFGGDRPPLEARLAMAFASVGAGDNLAGPLLVYRLGVERDGERERFVFFLQKPARRVWTGGEIEDDLARVFRRRLIEAERGIDRDDTAAPERVKRLPFGASVNVQADDLAAWLDGAVDSPLVARWLQRLVLFDWSKVPSDMHGLAKGDSGGRRSGLLQLYALLRPLVDPRALRAADGGELLSASSGARTVAVGRHLASLLHATRLDQAIALAFTRYRMADRRPASFAMAWSELDRSATQRLLSGLLLQLEATDLVQLNQRWMQPERRQGVRREREA